MIVNTVEIGELMRQVSPGTASAQYIEYRIHYLPHFQCHRPSRPFPVTTQKRLDDFPFLLNQITGVPTNSVRQYTLPPGLNRLVPGKSILLRARASRLFMASTDSLSIPGNGDALTVDWIQRALSAGGDISFIRDVAVEDISAGSGAIGAVLRCALTYHHEDPDMPKSVVIKLSSDDKKSLRIARLLSMYKREYFCFRQLAQSIPMGLPEGDYIPMHILN